MAKPLVPDELWAIVEPLLPALLRGGQRPVDDRSEMKSMLQLIFLAAAARSTRFFVSDTPMPANSFFHR